MKEIIFNKLISDSYSYNIKNLWEDLVSKYSEKHRFYHTFTHVNDCLNKMRFIIPLTKNEILIMELSIIFHDVIYNPGSTANELLSANYFGMWALKIKMPIELINIVYDYILSTKTHPVTNDELLQDFLDIDLSILGSEKEEFKVFNENIRKEYSFIPEDVYNNKRKEILEGFLSREFIYQNEIFRNLYEDKARYNIKEYLKYD